MKVLFLYTELAEYFLKCCEKLAENAEVHIVRWPLNKEAPFEFAFDQKIKIYDKGSYNLSQLNALAAEINPSIIICSGWIDKDYLKVVKQFNKKIPCVMSCDTHWTGSLKQYVAVILSRIFIMDRFTHAWVPGEVQKKYALKLGFSDGKIHQGFYSCDLEKFNKTYLHRAGARNETMRFLYVGRYYKFKGVQDLWQAFIEVQNESPCNAELWCLGTGDLAPIVHPKIRHFGFVQPKDLDPIIQQCSVFVLPSHFEPWGVVVQEYAASGFPLLLSTAVGASEAFLKEGMNGFSFKPGKVSEIKEAIKKMLLFSDKEVNSMSVISHEIAQRYSPKTWADTVTKINYERQKK